MRYITGNITNQVRKCQTRYIFHNLTPADFYQARKRMN